MLISSLNAPVHNSVSFASTFIAQVDTKHTKVCSRISSVLTWCNLIKQVVQKIATSGLNYSTVQNRSEMITPKKGQTNHGEQTQRQGCQQVDPIGGALYATPSPPASPKNGGERGWWRESNMVWKFEAKRQRAKWTSGPFLWTTMYKYKTRSEFSFLCFNFHYTSRH